jgi:hypothetical protein
MALQTLATVSLSYFLMRDDLHEWEFVEIAFGQGPGHVRLHTTLEGP